MSVVRSAPKFLEVSTNRIDMFLEGVESGKITSNGKPIPLPLDVFFAVDLETLGNGSYHGGPHDIASAGACVCYAGTIDAPLEQSSTEKDVVLYRCLLHWPFDARRSDPDTMKNFWGKPEQTEQLTELEKWLKEQPNIMSYRGQGPDQDVLRQIYQRMAVREFYLAYATIASSSRLRVIRVADNPAFDEGIINSHLVNAGLPSLDIHPLTKKYTDGAFQITSALTVLTSGLEHLLDSNKDRLMDALGISEEFTHVEHTHRPDEDAETMVLLARRVRLALGAWKMHVMQLLGMEANADAALPLPKIAERLAHTDHTPVEPEPIPEFDSSNEMLPATSAMVVDDD